MDEMYTNIMRRYYEELTAQLPTMDGKDKLDALCKAAFAFKTECATDNQRRPVSDDVCQKAETIFIDLYDNTAKLLEYAKDADERQKILMDVATAFHGFF